MANDAPALRLYNTLTRSKDVFTPIDPDNVRMYVCGPTVYDFAHIGNARPVIVFDVLFRLLRHLYGESRVTYVRNITDVDDKINARAARDFPNLPLNEAIRAVTEKTAAQFESDAAALGCLPPTVEPRATDNIVGMQALIATLLGNGHAYQAGGEVLFDTASMADYGQLSKRPLDENRAGARIAVDVHKKNPADFVLWKQSSADEPGWESPWGRGRPGWHIECSAMSERYLGQTFDIHGGGLDLIFPHHENEIAQSRCAHGTDVMANVWMHNGFLQVEGQKMSKSLGNFVTINDLMETEKFGGRKWAGAVLRLAMLMTHYREPIDFSVARLEEAAELLESWAAVVDTQLGEAAAHLTAAPCPTVSVLAALCNDLATPEVRALLIGLGRRATEETSAARELLLCCEFLGVMDRSTVGLLSRQFGGSDTSPESMVGAFDPVERYRVGRLNGDPSAEAVLADELRSLGITYSLSQTGKVLISDEATGSGVEIQINDRLAALNARDFVKADAIRADLLAQGIQLMDYKDPATGERRTKWEVKR